MAKDHPITDKRKKKPIVYRIKDVNEDVTVTQIETYKNGKGELRFDTPNLTGIFLSVSEKELDKAKVIYKSLIASKQSIREKIVLTEKETSDLYDYFECIQTTIVTLYSGIESLINVIIPEDYNFQETINGEIKTWDKKEIERWKPTKDKLKIILPDVFDIRPPTEYKCWSRFVEFERLRNDIIHVKTDTLSNKEADKRIIGFLISDSVFAKIKAAQELIKELTKNIGFHYEYPILNNSEKLEPIEVDTWSDTGFIKSE